MSDLKQAKWLTDGPCANCGYRLPWPSLGDAMAGVQPCPGCGVQRRMPTLQRREIGNKWQARIEATSPK